MSYFHIFIFDLGPRQVLDRLALEENLAQEIREVAIIGDEEDTHHLAVCGEVAGGGETARETREDSDVRLGVILKSGGTRLGQGAGQHADVSTRGIKKTRRNGEGCMVEE